MSNILGGKITINNDEELKVERTLELKKQNEEIKLLKQKLEQHFEFEIIDYIVADIVEHEDYNHFCLMVSLATVNERISEENAIRLKNEIKEISSINSNYDKLNKDRIKGHFKV